MLTKLHRDIALQLFDIEAIKFGQFKLKLHEKNPDAPLSPIYIDLRILRSFPDVMDAAVKIYKYMTNGITFDLYADVPTAVTPLVAVLSHETRIPMISPRIKEKAYGIGSAIDGVYQTGQIAIVVDDLITRADSKLDAISLLEENGLVVKDIVVLINREQGVPEELAKKGYICHSAFKLTEILGFYRDVGKIDEKVYNQIIDYILGNR